MTSRTYTVGSSTGARQAYIINNVTFDRRRNFKYTDRIYSDIDVGHLCGLLSQLNVKVNMKKNVPANEMKKWAGDVAAAIDSSREVVDCLFFIVLSYGEFGILEGKDRAIQADEIITPFKGDKCKKLAGKPKIFIFQACNPEFYGMDRLDRTEADDDPQMKRTYKIPAEADFHITWSLVPGSLPLKKGVRSSASMFLGALNEVLHAELERQKKGDAPAEYNSLMTRVLGRVDEALEEHYGDVYKTSEFLLPCAINMLTKSLYFPRNVTV